MDFSEKQTQIVAGALVFVVILLGVVFWKRSSPSSPTLQPGQSLSDPMGESAARGTAPVAR